MAIYFFDSSAVVKCYVEEIGTDWIIDTLKPERNNRIYLVRITGAEVVAALTRKRKANELSEVDATKSIQQFRQDLKTRYRIIEITSAIIDFAMSLAEEEGLRGYDAVQLAAALEVQRLAQQQGVTTLHFVSADQRKLDVINPQKDVSENIEINNPTENQDI